MSNENRQLVAGLVTLGLVAVGLASCEVPTEPGREPGGWFANPAAPPAPAVTEVSAVDVSHWSGPVTAGQVACWWSRGVRQVVVGTQQPAIAAQQLEQAAAGGMALEAYVVLEWDESVGGQVQAALSTIEAYPVQRLWLDAERAAGGHTVSQMVELMGEAETACGAFPCGIYTSKRWWQENLGDSQAFSHLPLWYPNYDGRRDFHDWYQPRASYEGPFGGWTTPTGKQYDSNRTAPKLCEVALDYNVMQRASATAAGLQAEIGRIAIRQPDRYSWHWVGLSQVYSNPVVIVQPPSAYDGEPGTVRVRNVTRGGFEVQFSEWSYLDGEHARETVGYLVAEAGLHRLSDGRTLEVGSVMVDQRFRTVSFDSEFTVPPVILTQVQSFNESSAVVTRQRRSSAAGFEVRLQEQEGADGSHALEAVGYIALDPGSGNFGSSAFEASFTPDPVSDGWHRVEFSRAYPNPTFLAGIQGYDEKDTAGLRHRYLGRRGVEVMVEEETSRDSEVVHEAETVGYVVLGEATGGGAPAVPTGLSPRADEVILTSSVTLSCDPIPGVVEYEFEIEYQNDGTWVHYHTYSQSESVKVFWPVRDDTRYRWRARARNLSGWSELSGWARFRFGSV